MSTSKLSGYSEECSSCESGWTEYLVSPVRGDDDNGESEFVLVDSGDEDRNAGSNKDTDDDDDEDDSMASDASTGLVNSKQSYAASDDESEEMDQQFKLGGDDDESAVQCSSDHESDKFYKVVVSNRRKCEPQTELNSTSLYGKSKDRKKRL